MTESAAVRPRARYRFVTFIDSKIVEGGIYVWERRMPGDSRVEQVRCPKSWFWSVPRAN